MRERVRAAVRVERDGDRAQEREGERIMQRGTQSASLAPCVGVSLRTVECNKPLGVIETRASEKENAPEDKTGAV